MYPPEMAAPQRNLTPGPSPGWRGEKDQEGGTLAIWDWWMNAHDYE